MLLSCYIELSSNWPERSQGLDHHGDASAHKSAGKEWTPAYLCIWKRAASHRSHYLPSSHCAGREKRVTAPLSPPKETSSTLKPGTWPAPRLANPKPPRFPVFYFTKAPAHWQEYLSVPRQTPAQCAWFNQEPPNSTVFPAEWKEIMKMHNQTLSSYSKMAISRISSPELWKTFGDTSSTSHSKDRAVGIHSKMS